MKSAAFEYARAASIAEVCDWLREDGDNTKLIAGGQSLVPMMAMRLTRPARLININEIDALKFIRVEKEFARTGACTRQCVIARDSALAKAVPLLKQALEWVGHVQTRNRGTVGGSLVHADPAAEMPLVAQILGAQMVLRSHAGTRTVNAADFFEGPLATATRADECLEEIRWPVWTEKRTGSAFTEISRRHGDFALVAAAAQIAVDGNGTCTRASFGLAGGGYIPMAFPDLAARLIGTKLEDEVVQAVVNDAATAFDPGGDLHASPEYRRQLATVLATRMLRAAYDGARKAS
jgi:CO/xanthine dehydrogenase FAD-binding subunit